MNVHRVAIVVFRAVSCCILSCGCFWNTIPSTGLDWAERGHRSKYKSLKCLAYRLYDTYNAGWSLLLILNTYSSHFFGWETTIMHNNCNYMKWSQILNAKKWIAKYCLLLSDLLSISLYTQHASTHKYTHNAYACTTLRQMLTAIFALCDSLKPANNEWIPISLSLFLFLSFVDSRAFVLCSNVRTVHSTHTHTHKIAKKNFDTAAKAQIEPIAYFIIHKPKRAKNEYIYIINMFISTLVYATLFL